MQPYKMIENASNKLEDIDCHSGLSPVVVEAALLSLQPDVTANE